MTKTLLIFGHGYTALALAPGLIADGWTVIGTIRTPQRAQALIDQGVQPVIWPGSDIDPVLTRASHILISAGPDENGDPVLNALRDQIARHARHIEWIGYLSTTGVYGDHQGGWVDEKTPVSPATRRGQLRVKAEAEWQSFAQKSSLTLNIFRLAGIYGPGRGPFSKVRNGTARRIIKPGQVFSRIHVEDIAQTLTASLNAAMNGAIYNLCDDNPAPPQDVIAYAAKLLGLPVPPGILWQDADLTPMARSFYAESKMVKNDLIKCELGVRLKYPTYQSGLKALLAQEP